MDEKDEVRYMTCEKCGSKLTGKATVYCTFSGNMCADCFEEYLAGKSLLELADSMGIEVDQAENFYEVGRGYDV